MWDWGFTYLLMLGAMVLYWIWPVKPVKEDKLGVRTFTPPPINSKPGAQTFRYTHAEGTKPHMKEQPRQKPEPENYTKEQFRLDYLTCMGHLDIPAQVALIKINKLLIMRLLNVKLDHGEQAYWEDIRRLKGHGS